jgi:diacylglycerol kinase (ATP)
MQHIWVIVNYFSGGKSARYTAWLKQFLNSKPKLKIKETQYALHAKEIAQQAVNEGIGTVIAIGGDGTINEIGSVLAGSTVAMGIVPKGSGNGLARHLGLPMDTAKALQFSIENKAQKIDMAAINDHPFFCAAGIGFDAVVALHFASQKGRGLFNYLLSSALCYFSYKPLALQLEINNELIECKAFTLGFCNAGQFGNNAWMAPQANITDGLIDVVLLQPFPLWKVPFLAWQLFNKTLPNSKYYTSWRCRQLKVHSSKACLIHFDGEPLQTESQSLHIKMTDKKLNVIY